MRFAALACCCLVLSWGALATAEEATPTRDLLVSTHARLGFDQGVKRVAVADPEVLSFEPINEQEGLVLGRAPGRTTVLVWFADGSVRTYLFHVKRDFSMLEEALREVHASISVRSAPDRDAVVLRGVVPDVSTANAAEELAQRYLDARRGGGKTQPAVVRADPVPTSDSVVVRPTPKTEPVDAPRASGTVINLIRVQSLPSRVETRIQSAIKGIGINDVRIQRLMRGRIADDDKDVFVLQGSVKSQIELIRVLSMAQSMLGLQQGDAIRVRADESGALTGTQRGGASGTGIASGGALSQLFGGGGSSSSLQNLIESNVGRAKVIDAGGGRILSFIEVSDLPQVRVDIRLYEVNCTRLRSFNSQLGGAVGNVTQGSLNPARTSIPMQGAAAPRVGTQSNDVDVQNVIGFLSGTLSNQFQLHTDHFVMDSLMSLLEQKGFARSLSRPSLTVLSGERAFFQVGGEIPVPTSFATDANQGAQGVLNSVAFRPFGVQLSVRPLVGRNGEITLDLAPQISLPDAQLTAGIRQATGTAQSTTSFRTRSLQTTAKLEDSQSLLVGGLITRNVSNVDNGTPGLSDLPLLGGVFDGYERQGDEFQLVVLVHPVVMRKPEPKARAWAFPSVDEMMVRVGRRRTRCTLR